MSFRDIIAKVKARPELWQSAHPFYRHRIVCAGTWKQIAAELRADDWVQIKKRWKHMKDSFRKEVKKVTTKQIEQSSWIHFKELDFLTDEILKRQIVPDTDGSENEAETKVKPVVMKKVRKRKRLEPTAPSETAMQNSIKFKKIIRSLNILCKHVGRSTSFVDDDLKNDPDYMFLVSLLPTMKNLSDIQRLHFRGKINNWLLSALMENEFSDCDSKANVQTQINQANIKDCKIELGNE